MVTNLSLGQIGAPNTGCTNSVHTMALVRVENSPGRSRLTLCTTRFRASLMGVSRSESSTAPRADGGLGLGFTPATAASSPALYLPAASSFASLDSLSRPMSRGSLVASWIQSDSSAPLASSKSKDIFLILWHILQEQTVLVSRGVFLFPY